MSFTNRCSIDNTAVTAVLFTTVLVGSAGDALLGLSFDWTVLGNVVPLVLR